MAHECNKMDIAYDNEGAKCLNCGAKARYSYKIQHLTKAPNPQIIGLTGKGFTGLFDKVMQNDDWSM